MCNIFSENLLFNMGNLSTFVGLILKIRNYHLCKYGTF